MTADVGNETFEVNDATEVVQAQAGAASNTMFSSVSYTLPTHVDVLTLTGTGNLTAHGNNDASNLITANDGNDTLVAGSGHDTLVSGKGVDLLQGGAGPDAFYVNNASDQIYLPSFNGSQDTIYSSVSYTLYNTPGQVYNLTLTGTSRPHRDGLSWLRDPDRKCRQRHADRRHRLETSWCPAPA